MSAKPCNWPHICLIEMPPLLLFPQLLMSIRRGWVLHDIWHFHAFWTKLLGVSFHPICFSKYHQIKCNINVLNIRMSMSRMSNVHIKFFWLLFSIRYSLSHCAQGTVLCEIVGHERNVNTLRGTNCLFPCPGSDILSCSRMFFRRHKLLVPVSWVRLSQMFSGYSQMFKDVL